MIASAYMEIFRKKSVFNELFITVDKTKFSKNNYNLLSLKLYIINS